MNICVLGACGFIGSHITDMLINIGHNVVVIDYLTTGNINNLNPKAVFIQRDINNNLSDIFDQYKFKYVYHLAAQINLRKSIEDPLFDAQTNISGSLNILNEAKRIGAKVIFTSTGGAIYSPMNSLPLDENSTIDPQSPYGLSKFTIEKYLEMYNKLYGLEYCILRLANVYGIRQNTNGECGIVSILINNALNNKQTTIYGRGDATRDYINVEDVVSAAILAMKLNGIYNVSTNIATSVNKLIKIVNKKIKYDNIAYAPKIKGELMHSRLCSDKLQYVGWKPTIDIEAGINSTIDFYRSL